MAVCDVVVIGSYPPVPGPATAAALAAVRRAWDDGLTVRVVSFRPGAGDIFVPVAGPLAGWRLEQVRRHYAQPPQVVLVLQAGVPFTERRYRDQLATASGLAVGLRRWQRPTLVVAEDPKLPPPCFRLLAKAAGELLVGSESAAAVLAERYNMQIGAFSVAEVEPYPPLPPGVDLDDAGLFRPRAARGLHLVDMPTTTLAERVRARHLSRFAFLRRLRGR
ncbi:MAG TPA: hypothetical protein VME20_08145 [Acidimicrobiales bacterium]|nr:hypothetical protein [Acidimicrobiales bacterium]